MKFRLKAHSQFKPTKWNENTIEALSAQQKITATRAEFSYTGDFQGSSTVEYLMFYRYFDELNRGSAQASYVGLVRFSGELGGKKGAFIWQETGNYENGIALGDMKVVEGSGTGELEGISGRGSVKSSSSDAEIDLDYTLDLGYSRMSESA